MAKNAAKKSKKSPSEKALSDLQKQIAVFNQINGTDFYIASASGVEKDLRVKAAMTFAFSEQFALDKVLIVLNNQNQFGESRFVKFQKDYLELSEYFRELEKEDGLDEFGVAHTVHEFETTLKQAVKDLYVEREKRYHINVTYNGEKVDGVETKDWSKD